MANESMPWQLTVAELRKALEHAQDEAVVTLEIPPGFKSPEDLTLICNVEVVGTGIGPVFKLAILAESPGGA
jgi:hypothetical protein